MCASPNPEVGDFTIYRVKGYITLTDGSMKMIQGVRQVFEISDFDPSHMQPIKGSEAQAEELSARRMLPYNGGKIVLIGKGLEGWLWMESLYDVMR